MINKILFLASAGLLFMRGVFIGLVYLACGPLFLSGCSKKIVSDSGRVWYSPSERQPFQGSAGAGNDVSEFSGEVFVNGNVSRQNPALVADQSGSDKQIENAVNNTFASSQGSALQLQESRKEGQVDLTKSYVSNNKKKSPSKLNEVKSGSIIFQEKVESERCNACNTTQTKVAERPVEVADTIDASKRNLSYKIQCGNYVNKYKADEIANNLKKHGIQNVVVRDDGETYRIFAGDFTNKEEGQSLFMKIKELGYGDIFWVYK